MILLLSSVFSAITSALGGIVLGVMLAGLIIVKIVQARLRHGAADMHDKLPEEYKIKIAGYIKDCEKSTERLMRKRLKKKKKWLFAQLIDKVKEKNKAKRDKKRNMTVPVEPPTEVATTEVAEEVQTPVDEKIWYPMYLLAHNIAILYMGEETLSFLKLNENDVFGIVSKVASALETLLDGVGIDKLKKLKAGVLLETLELVRTIMSPLHNKTVKTVYSRTLQGYSEIMRVKHAISINPFYYLRRAIKRKITVELVIESVKCAIDVIAVEIINIYKHE